jgi:hypothetical protein
MIIIILKVIINIEVFIKTLFWWENDGENLEV